MVIHMIPGICSRAKPLVSQQHQSSGSSDERRQKFDSLTREDTNDTKAQVQCDPYVMCDLSNPSDLVDLVDAVSKMLRMASIPIQQRKVLFETFRNEVYKLNIYQSDLQDKSTVISCHLRKANNLSGDDDITKIPIIVIEMTEVIRL